MKTRNRRDAKQSRKRKAVAVAWLMIAWFEKSLRCTVVRGRGPAKPCNTVVFAHLLLGALPCRIALCVFYPLSKACEIIDMAVLRSFNRFCPVLLLFPPSHRLFSSRARSGTCELSLALSGSLDLA